MTAFVAKIIGVRSSTAKEAEDYAAIVAEELSRNHAKNVTVFVVSDDRSQPIVQARPTICGRLRHLILTTSE
jgi:hypothetical protein